MRLVIALGGNALVGDDGGDSPDDQRAAVGRAVGPLADVVTAGHEVLLTHGNGPQVGDLLRRNELAAADVPPDPLDWCDAQTQATIGTLLMDALDAELARRGPPGRTATLVSRTLVDAGDPGFAHPTKPIGRHLTEDEKSVLEEHGQVFTEVPRKGWRRVVASPEPLRIVDAPAVQALVDAGFVVVANGGGGIPVVEDADGTLHGVEAVIDKDLGAALLAEAVGADVLVIGTDVPHAVLRYGTPEAEELRAVTVSELRRHAADGHFASGSMGPKVDAACRFVEAGGSRAVITDLAHLSEAVTGAAGTVVVPN
jgi:carbamate kinase